MLMFSYDEKCESKQMEIKQELPEESKQRKTWALPHFFWLLLLPLFEVTWQVFTLEVVGTALGLLGLYTWGFSKGLIALLVTWFAALPCLVQITWQVALCSLPFILCFLILCEGTQPANRHRYYGSVAENIGEALLLLYCMALPMSGIWQWLVGLELAAYLFSCGVACYVVWFEKDREEKQDRLINTCILCALPFGAFALITKLSYNLTGPLRQSLWQWGLFTPCGLVTMYCGVEAFFVLWNRHKLNTVPSRADMLTRLLVISALGLAPVVLATDVEAWQGGVEAPDLNPVTYLNISFQNWSLQNWSHFSIETKKKQLHWLHMPQPLWPSTDDLARASTTTRSQFWLTYMCMKFLFVAVVVLLVLVLKCSCTSNQSSDSSPKQSTEGQPLTAEAQLERGQGDEEAQTMSFEDRHRLLMFSIILPIHLTIVIKVTCTAAFFGQLTPNTGLAYEGYDLCLTCGLLWLVAQALALRAADFAARYSATDVALTMLVVVPFLGDAFDSLKDAMLGALALRSRLVPLQYLGFATISYLVILHGFLARSSSNRLELQKSYLPFLFLRKKRVPSNIAAAEGTVHDTLLDTLDQTQMPSNNPAAEGICDTLLTLLDSVSRRLLVELYKQSTPSRQWAMLLEDSPQGVLALLVSLADGFQAFTVVVNIGVPVFRITFAWLLHDRIAWRVADWLFQEALNAAEAQQLAVCDEFVAALLRLQTTFPERDLWQHLQERNRDCCLGATVRQSQSHVGLQRFILMQQPIAKDDESSANRWEKVTELLNQCAPEEFLAAKARCLVLLQQLNGNNEEDESPANLWEKVIQLLGQCTPKEILARLQRLLELQQLIAKHEESSANRWGKVIKLLGQMSPEEMLEAKESITRASLCLKPSELVLPPGEGFGAGLASSMTILEAISKPQQVTNLTLNLGSNDIGSEGARAVAEAVVKFQQITNFKLRCRNNGMGPEGAKAVAEAVGKLQHITNLTLDLGYNGIGPEGARAVGDSLAKLQQITNFKLHFRNNGIGPEGVRAVAEAVATMQHITDLVLWLQNNDVGTEGARAVGDSLAKLQHITNLTLNLDHNGIGIEGARAVGDSLAKLQHITDLRLYFNRNGIGPEGVRAVVEAVATMQHITDLVLGLEDNDVETEGARAAAEAVATMQQITNVKLNFDGYLDSKVKAEIERRLQKPGRTVEVRLRWRDFELESDSSSGSLAEP